MPLTEIPQSCLSIFLTLGACQRSGYAVGMVVLLGGLAPGLGGCGVVESAESSMFGDSAGR